MDSRSKIVLPAAVPPGTRVVSGYFDPLLAIHPRWLEELKGPGLLAVVVRNPPAPILPARARAELVAALRIVDFVMLDAADAPQPDLTIEDRDAAASAAFVAHVRQRQG